MSRIKLLYEVMEDLKRLAESVEALANAVDEDGVTEKVQGEITGVSHGRGNITIEQVREILAAKYRSGRQDQVRELIRKYGGEKLAEIEPSRYGELLKEAEGL